MHAWLDKDHRSPGMYIYRVGREIPSTTKCFISHLNKSNIPLTPQLNLYNKTSLFPPQVEKWRTGASVAWSVLLLPAVTLTALAVATIDPLHPLTWIYSMSTSQISVISFKNTCWCYLTYLCLIRLPLRTLAGLSHITLFN